jgi:hypothetical protein
LFFLFDIYTSDVVYCSGNEDDLINSDTDDLTSNDTNRIADLDRLRELRTLRDRIVSNKNELEHLRTLSIIQMRANPVGREHTRFYRMYRGITAEISGLLRSERTVNDQIRRLINRYR